MPVYRNAYSYSLSGYEHYENSATRLEADYFTTSSHISHHATYGTYESQTVNPSDTRSSPSPTPLLPPSTPPTNPKTKRSNHARRKDPNYIPRPRNAFIIFRSTFIANQQRDADAPRKSQNEISKQAAAVWNGMTVEERKPFVHQAMLEKVEHQFKYPDYTYSPGRVSGKGRDVGKGKGKSKQAKSQYDSDAPSPVPSSPTSCGSPATPQQPFAFASPGQAYYTTPYDVDTAALAKEKLDTTTRPFNYNVIESQFAGVHEYTTTNDASCTFPSATPPPFEDDDDLIMYFPYVTPFAFPTSDPIHSPPASTFPELALPPPDAFYSQFNSYFKRSSDLEPFDFGHLPMEGELPSVQYAPGVDGLWYPAPGQQESAPTVEMGVFFDY